MYTLWQDIRFGLRMMLRVPAFTFIAVLTLALGIGANTAIFSIAYGVLLRPLPYRNPSQLIKIWGSLKNEGIPQNWISEPEYWDLKRANLRTVSDLAVFQTYGRNLANSGSSPVRVTAGAGTANLLSLLGVSPIRGRFYSPEEDVPGKDRVAVISYELWQQLGGREDILHTELTLDAQNYTVIGVLPPGFQFSEKLDLWIPLALDPVKPEGRGGHYLEMLARLKPGATIPQATAELAGFADQLAKQYPRNYPSGAGFTFFAESLRTDLIGNLRLASLILLGAATLVLLIACANVANLLLARSSARQKEFAIRDALGAPRYRIIRQLLTESVLLSLTGGILGVSIAYWSSGLVERIAPGTVPVGVSVRVDVAVLLFTLAISTLTGILFGLAPALHAGGADSSESLKEAGRSSSGPSSQRIRGALVISEVALAMLLLAGAGLMLRSFARLIQVNPGFQAEHLFSARISIPGSTYKSDASVLHFYNEVSDRVSKLPGVKSAGFISQLPLSGANSSETVVVDQTKVEQSILHDLGFAGIEADRRIVTPGFMQALGVPLREGRLLTDADSADAPLVAVVDEDFARRFWPDESAVGHKVAYNAVDENANPPVPKWRTIVGVVAHIKFYNLSKRGREQIYFPLAQRPDQHNMSLVVRNAGDPDALSNAVRREVASIDPTLPVYHVRTIDDLLEEAVAQPRMNLVLLGSFGALALLLAAIGIYGVMSYTVTLRSREIGIRMALGARPRDVRQMVLRQASNLLFRGIIIGLVGALLATNLMETMLYGTSARDPFTFAAITVLLSIIALLASFVPALRASRVDPMVALRYE